MYVCMHLTYMNNYTVSVHVKICVKPSSVWQSGPRQCWYCLINAYIHMYVYTYMHARAHMHICLMLQTCLLLTAGAVQLFYVGWRLIIAPTCACRYKKWRFNDFSCRLAFKSVERLPTEQTDRQQMLNWKAVLLRL